MLHYRFSLFLLLLLSTGSPTLAEDKLPAGTIQKGTLCNQKLIMDAKVGVAGKVGALGCMKPETLEMFVVKNPSGKPGSRFWEEKWIVAGCEKKFPIDIRFSEDGAGGALWTIVK